MKVAHWGRLIVAETWSRVREWPFQVAEGVDVSSSCTSYLGFLVGRSHFPEALSLIAVSGSGWMHLDTVMWKRNDTIRVSKTSLRLIDEAVEKATPSWRTG